MATITGCCSCGSCCSNDARCLQPVHFGHMQIHKQDIVGVILQCGNCLTTVRCYVGAVPETVQQALSNFLIDDIIFYYQDLAR